MFVIILWRSAQQGTFLQNRVTALLRLLAAPRGKKVFFRSKGGYGEGEVGGARQSSRVFGKGFKDTQRGRKEEGRAYLVPIARRSSMPGKEKLRTKRERGGGTGDARFLLKKISKAQKRGGAETTLYLKKSLTARKKRTNRGKRGSRGGG